MGLKLDILTEILDFNSQTTCEKYISELGGIINLDKNLFDCKNSLETLLKSPILAKKI